MLKVVVYEDKVEITLCYGNDLLKLVADDYGKDNSLRFRIVEFTPARILDKKRKHNFEKIVFSLAEKEGFYPFAVPDIYRRGVNPLAICRPLHSPAHSLHRPQDALVLGSP